MSRLGFTGTRNGITPSQKEELISQLEKLRVTHEIAMHGDCRGADAYFGLMAHARDYWVETYPGCTRDGESPYRAFSYTDDEHALLPYLERNRLIVDKCDLLLACPMSSTPSWSGGTWYTIRYASTVHKPTIIIYPDGKIEYTAETKEDVNGENN